MGDSVKFIYPEGATPLAHEELQELIPPHITLQSELNLWEQNNILLGEQWALRQREILTDQFVQTLHYKMFDQTWKWAGIYRQTGKNIGIDWHFIPTEIRRLCDDVRYQIEHQSYDTLEIAVRFHHRLVWIHPFPNGNGRHARLMADLLLMQNNFPRFSWGQKQMKIGNLYETTPIRKLYIQALREADQHDYAALIKFAMS